MRRITLTLTAFIIFSIGCNTAESSESPETLATDTNKATSVADFDREDPFVRRPLSFDRGDEWVGNAVCYGPHRDGQGPDGDSPNREQLLEDLHILSEHWQAIRMYGSEGVTEDVLQLIEEHQIDMRVIVGAWIANEVVLDEKGQVVETRPDTVKSNRVEVDTAIRLANTYPDTVAAITVGNETQVFWSFHKVRQHILINYIRQARAQTKVPVSTADVSTYWLKPDSVPVADEVDFIMTHIYAMWNKQPLDDALGWTKEQYGQGVSRHPDHLFVIGEAGWATTKHNEGEQATLITAEANEDAQLVFYRQYLDWVTQNKIPNFYFEAFDENWKGGDHPNEVEKHWGLFNADRTPKRAISETN